MHTGGVDRNINYILGILTLRAIDWCLNELILRGSGNLGGGLQNFTAPLSRNILESSAQAQLIGILVGWFKKRVGSGCLVYDVIEMHGMPPSRPRGYVRQITSNWFQTCSSRIALWINCMIEGKKCFGRVFGWICALKRWSVQECVQTCFCPTARQVLHYLAWELCRQIAAPILSRLTPFLLVWGSGRGLGGGGGGHFGPEAQNLYVHVRIFFFPPPDLYECRCMSDGVFIQFVCQFFNLMVVHIKVCPAHQWLT